MIHGWTNSKADIHEGKRGRGVDRMGKMKRRALEGIGIVDDDAGHWVAAA
jgi:hypothetical protein